MLLEMPAATALLQETLQDLWNRERRPILGSKLKIELLRRARERDLRFEERALGFRRFSEFVAATGAVEISDVGGADILIAPKLQRNSATPSVHRSGRIRPDFWRAFMSYPVAGQVRAYDAANDKIVTAAGADGLPEGAAPIESVPKDQQLEWRREFAKDAPEGHWLRELKLEHESGLHAFSDAIRNDPLRRKWNDFWLEKATQAIRQWAERHNVPERIWVSSDETRSQRPIRLTAAGSAGAAQRDAEREKLYAVLDQISLDHLLEITIPLRWLIK
jgi:hypothetical protein